MAAPTITQVTQTYQGISILCARVICTDPCSYKFSKVVNAADDYLFQMVAKTSSGTKQLTIHCGDLSETLDINATFDRYVMSFPSTTIYDDNSLYIDFPAGTYYLYNLQLERGTTPTKWQPAPEDAAAYSDKVAADAVNGLTQQQIFNKLTNNGAVQGITLVNGQLYINASYIQSGTLVLGGVNNGNGTLKVVDATNATVGTWTKDGINLISGTIGGWTVTRDSLYKIDYFLGSPRSEAGLASGWTDTSAYTRSYDDAKYTQAALRLGHLNLGYYDPDVSTYMQWAGEISSSSATYAALDNQPIMVLSPTRAFSINPNSSRRVFYQENPSGNTFTPGNFQNGVLYLMPLTRVDITTGLTVSGTKSRVANAGEYSDRLLYCYETPSPMFGDVGEGELSEDGRAYIWLDPIFAKTIATHSYQVFIQQYGDGSAYIAERHPDHFVVEGTPGLRFGWELKGKQADFDQLRLEKDSFAYSHTNQSYGEQAADYIQELNQGRISA